MQKIILNISGMTCSACSSSLEKYLKKQPGIIDASVNLVLAQALITYEDNLTLNTLEKYIKEAGFKSLGIFDETKLKKNKHSKTPLIIYGILALLVLYIAMAHMVNLPVIPFLNMMDYPINYAICLLIFSLIFLFYGKDIILNGYKNLIHKSPNMDTLVTIGVLSSFFYSLYNTIMILKGHSMYVESLYYESVCIIIYFLKLGRFIDNINKEKTYEAIKGLVQITPSKALKLIDGKRVEITLDEIKKGDILLCLPGMKIACDGIVSMGTTYVDESFITGESTPVKKDINNKVVAGSLNINGSIEYIAQNIGKDSTISKIVHLVVEATNTKPKIASLADKVSGIFVPIVIILSILTFIFYMIFTHDINLALTHFVTVLVVACPCALGLATPLSIVVSEGKCAQNGILIKKSQILEDASKIDTIVMDKTGTLTYGTLKISKLYNYSKYSEDKLLYLVGCIETNSNHPIAKSLVNKETKYEKVTDFKNLDGLGLEATLNNKKYYLGNSKLVAKLSIKNTHVQDEQTLTQNGSSIIYVIENNKIIALIGVKDIIKKDMKEVISKLEDLNINTIMLTGDNETTANLVAKELNIKEVIANVYPQDKTNEIKNLQSKGKKVMMVGDGINDAPSLATANIGVTVANATDIASNSSDVILLNDSLMSLVKLINISTKTLKIIKENLFWAFFYNIITIPIAMGLLTRFNITMNPMLGSLAMMLSSLTVILNALRLRK